MIFLTAHGLRLASLNIRLASEPNQGIPDAIIALVFSLAYFLGLKRFFPVMFVTGAVLMLAPIRLPKPRMAMVNRKFSIRFE